jgi:4-hydroxy-4-methyl-2-oxoglutarate aldolase
MKPVVITGPPRTRQAVVDALGKHGVATVHEAMGRRGLLGPQLRPVWPGARAAGTAVTALCLPGDNLTVHLAVEQASAGDLLVITATSPSTDGYVGELFTTALTARGVVGLVTTTGIRDVAEIRSAQFPAWSRAVSAQGTVKATAGEVNRPVSIDGTVVRPGDAVIADDDGVVCVPRERADSVLAACERRVDKEGLARAAYAKGELSLDINHLRGLVSELGVEYRSWDDDQR